MACQEDKGPPEAQKIVKSILEKMYQKYGTDFYVLQCDIQGYYDNVNHERIKEQFSGMQAMGYILFMNIVDGWKKTDCYAAENDPAGEYGVPKGNLPSQWIGLAYLNEVDWYIAQRDDNEGQVRYMDDFLTFFHLKSSCKDCKIKIEKYLEEHSMGVRLHPQKTKYMPIKQGFTFCGWQYSIDDKGRIKCRVRTDRKRLTKKRMKRLSEDYCKGKVTSFDVKQKMNGTIGNTYNVDYSGATKSKVNDAGMGSALVISAILYDQNGKIVYYGPLSTVTSESGKVAITIPNGIQKGTYTLALFEEQLGGTSTYDTSKNSKNGTTFNGTHTYTA